MRLWKWSSIGWMGVLAGCTTVEVDAVPVCVGSSTEGVPLRVEEGDSLALFYSVSRGGCSRLEAPSCRAEVNGDVIDVRTEYLRVDRLEQSCTYDLNFEIVQCETGPLPAGAYTVRYAGRERELPVPYDELSFCMRGAD